MTKKTEVKAKAKGADAEKKVVAKATKGTAVEKKVVAKVVKGADQEKKVVKKIQDGNKAAAAAKKPVEKKPVEKKEGDKKPFEKKPFVKKTFEKKPFEKKPFEKKSFEKKPYVKKTFEKNADGTPLVGKRTWTNKDGVEQPKASGPKGAQEPVLNRRQKQKVSDLIKKLRISYNRLLMKKKEMTGEEKHAVV